MKKLTLKNLDTLAQTMGCRAVKREAHYKIVTVEDAEIGDEEVLWTGDTLADMLDALEDEQDNQKYIRCKISKLSCFKGGAK